MAKYSLHLAVNEPDIAHYGTGVIPSLQWAHQDARDWRTFFKKRGWEDTTGLVGPNATTEQLEMWVARVASLKDADLVVITWSGHGAQVPRLSHPQSDGELDNYDELWVLHDRFLFDDEIHALMARFAPPARVVMIVDSCHSGGSFRLQPSTEDLEVEAGRITPRALDDGVASQVVDMHKDLYDQVRTQLDSTVKTTARFVGLAACRDSERAYEADGNGVFTRALLNLLQSGTGDSYHDLVQAAAAATPYQHPRVFWYDEDGTMIHQPAFS